MRTDQDSEEFISESEAEKLLHTLCADYGFCLSALWQARLKNKPPKSAVKFAETVVHAEGLNPISIDSALYKQVLVAVQKAFAQSAENGGDGNA